jgi:hypothetical protein
MKIATKTLTSLLIITIISLSATTMAAAASNTGGQKAQSRIERITRHHDRKMELQASVLGVTPNQLKEELKTSTFDQVLKKHGFKTREDFRVAIAGKLKDELKKRGWSDEKIQKLLDKKLAKLGNKT